MNIDHILEADGNVYRTHIASHGVTFNFRLLTLKEYKVYRSFRDGGVLPEWSVADEVFERCFLGEASLISSDLPAGLTVSIGKLIIYLSGIVMSFLLKRILLSAGLCILLIQSLNI